MNKYISIHSRGNGVMTDWKTPFEEVEIGEKIKDGTQLLLSIGHTGNFVLYDIDFVKD